MRRPRLLPAALCLAAAVPLPGLRAAVFSPASYGAAFSENVNDAPALQKAIDAASAAGGGTVAIPAGRTVMAGSITLKSNVTLDLEPGSRLLGSVRRADYRGETFIHAVDADNVTIEGDGTIDGRGLHFLGKEGRYIYERTATDWRPRLILLQGCRHVAVKDVNLRNAGFWTLDLAGCDDVSIHGISIRNSLKAPNCDGIDADHSRNVRIADCSVSCGDDGIVAKASREFSQYGPCENITVSHCVVTTHDCAFKIGSETTAPIRNVVFSDCVVNQCGRGIGILLRDQGDVENIVAHDIIIHSQLFHPEWWGASEAVYVDAHPRTPGGRMGVLRNLRFSHILARGEAGVFIQGCSACVPNNIVLQDVTLDIAKSTPWPSRIDLRPPEALGILQKDVTIAGFHLDRAREVTVRDCTVHWGPNPPASYGPAIQATRVEALTIDGFHASDAHAP
ncbi:MAG: glycoside hydrolase family 28 protein [Opitutaceae bacterium]